MEALNMSPNLLAEAIDRSIRDRGAQLAINVLISRRDDVDLDTFYNYWGDIHGVMAARADGAADYWQHRLTGPVADFFPGTSGVDQSAAEGDPIVGMAEITFATEAGRTALVSSAAVAQMVIDEQNVLKGTYMYASAPGNTLTLLDRMPSNTPQGPPDGFTLLVLVRQQQGTSQERFRDYMRQTLGRFFAASHDCTKARVHLMEPYDSGTWPTPNVDHARTANQQYQAILELAFRDEGTARRLVQSDSFALLSRGLPDVVRALTTYVNFETYTLVYGGRPTHAGLRGVSAIRTLQAVGQPANEQSMDALQVLFGERVLEPLA
jgi:hypothetical protein